ncbi:Ig-like domain-containing protein [Bacillus sp. FJAT-29937]|uniref:Ig-like domain-containing protein n=1 Tax=Bacillus sp. FJAT-29937 TaxID=1720553 RepID=UPI0008308ABC|nr:hypothetical protein [Bacillus sp. FJAT-29937]
MKKGGFSKKRFTQATAITSIAAVATVAPIEEIPLMKHIFSNDIHTAQAAVVNKPINQLKRGDTIIFAGKEYKVLNPSTGYIIATWSYGRHTFDDNNSPVFDTNKMYANVGWWLNNYYYNQIPAADQAKIQTVNWGIGRDGSENSRTVSAKISLISHDEFDAYFDVVNYLPVYSFWTRTPNSGWGPTSVFWAFTNMPGPGYWNSTYANQQMDVVPVMYLYPTTVVGAVYPNANPIFSQIPAQSTVRGQNKTVSLASYFSDPDGDTLTFSASSSNTGVGNASVSGNTLTLSPTGLGSSTITVTANDGKGGTVSQTFTFSVTNRNPGFTQIPTQSTVRGQNKTVSLASYFSDPDGDSLTFSATSSNTGVGNVSVSGSTLTLSPTGIGSSTITVTANDGKGGTVNQSFTFNVDNQKPNFTQIPEQSTIQGQNKTVNLAGYFSDPDSDALTFTATSSQTGVGTTSISGSILTITPKGLGNSTITVTGNDGKGGTVSQSFTFTVQNQAPTITISNDENRVLNGDKKIIITGTVNDIDGDNITVSATIDGVEKSQVVNGSGNYSLEWDALNINEGTYQNIVVTAKDEKGAFSTETYTKQIVVDKTPPADASFTVDESNPTNQDVSLTITFPDDAAVKQYKIGAAGTWTDYTGPITLTSNDTLFARSQDIAGNWSNETSVIVANIDKDAPVITLTSSKLDPTNTEIDVNVQVVDNNSIIEKKWAKGNQNEAYFATSGTDITGDSFIVSENGTYTVFAKDSAGNISLKTINISNIDMDAPVIVLTPSKIDPVNTEIDVNVEVTDYTTVVERKWAKGTQSISFFATGGTSIEGDSFIVNENGTYTVYAKDSAGNESLQTIEISNIDMDAPIITLTPSKIDPVNAEIDVAVEVTDYTAIVTQKWAKGNQNLAYFQSNGTDIINGKFVVNDNDVYTVYAKDSAGNESIQTITISNIDVEAPVITLTPSILDPINTEVDVDVEIVDHNPIVEKKWAAGNQDLAYFQTGGTAIINDKFIVSENGTYTVYAKDSAGNESLQTIEISNIDMDAPDVALLEASTTVPTNQNVEVTITYPDDAVVKEYKIGTGAWFAYEGPISVTSNDTVYARGQDAAGNWSEESSLVISNIDKIAPVITITGVTNGNTYVNEITPIVTVEDFNTVETTILLNGEAYAGETITESGSYILTVKTKDAAGNESTKTVAFHVNHTPKIVGTIPDKTWKKFEEESIDLSTIFTDKEDNLTYTVTSSDENIISVIEKDGSLHIKALMQGSATITIVAHDGYSESEPVSFKVEVNSVAPTVSLTNDQTWVIADGEKLIIEGIVKDADKEQVVVTATVNGVEKSVTVLTTGEDDVWSIEFDGADIGTGVHTVSVQAKDPFESSADVASNKFIVKIPVPLAEYEPILSGYEVDINKDRQDFSESEHTVLLDAFVAVESLKTTNNPDAWLTIKPKVDMLADGTVKTAFYKKISGNALDYLIDNLDTATKSDYETAGFTDVQENLVPTYNEKNSDYLAERKDLTEQDIQLIIDIVNAVDKASSSNLVEDWKTAKSEIEKLEDGALKDDYLQVVEDGFVKAIEVNPDKLTSELLGQELSIIAHPEREVDYQMYLKDELTVDPVLTKERLENIIKAVDNIYDLIDSFKKQPTQEHLTSFENKVDALTDGLFQSKNEGLLPSFNLEMVVNDPSTMTEIALNTIGVTHDISHLPLYQDFLRDYLVDVSKEEVTKEVLQRIIDVVDAIEKVKENPTDENIQDLLDLIGGLNPDASIIDDILDEVGGSILDKINEDFSNVTEKQLENIGTDNIDSSRLPEYQEALNDYAKEKDPTDLTRDDIQKVIDAVNGVEDAKANPSEESIREGYEAVNQLDDGPLKDRILQELEDIAVDFIANNPDKITQDLLDYANLETDPDLLDSYKDYLQDVLPGLTEEITKEKLQELIDKVNEVWAAYYEAINNPSEAKVLAYETLVNSLVDGVFKTKMIGLIDDVALAYLIASPATQEADDYARLGMTIKDENIPSYNSNMAKYITDIGSDKFSFTEVQQVITVTDKVETALIDSKTANVQQALLEVRNLQSGKLKTDLNAALNGQVIGDINLNPGTVTADDLINLGIENVNPDFEELYQDALTKLKDDLGGTLTFEDVQNAVDSVNAVEKALETGNNQDIINAFEEIKELPDGSLKDYLTDKLQEEVIKEIIENPENITTEHLENGGFTEVDHTLEEEYKDAIGGYEQPLTAEAVQQLIDVVNQVKKTRLDLTQDDVNKLGKMVDELAASDTKENLVLVKDALKALLDSEQFMNNDNIRDAFNKVALVNTREKSYLMQMANSLSFVRTALGEPSDEAIAAAQQELLKLDNGDLKERMQSRVGGAYLEHVITSPGSTNIQDWINAGFDNVMDETFPIYKGAVDAITSEKGQLTKEQIQNIINAINAIETAKKNPTNQTIQIAKDAINKVVDSQLKLSWLAEMDELWKSIQPKPVPKPDPAPTPIPDKQPEPVKPPVIKPEQLPKPSDTVMVSSNKHAAIVMSIPKIEVAETDSLKVKIKVSANDILEGSKLYLYADSASLRQLEGTAVASNNPLFMKLVAANKKPLIEIDFGKLDRGTLEVDRDLVFDENGEYLLKGIFIANGTNLETNTVKVSVFKELLIPNTVLPNPHGLPVATLKANQDIPLFKKDKDGNFVQAGGAKAGTLHLVYDTEKGFYKLADGLYAQSGHAVTVHIGKGEVRKDEVNVYDKNGRFIRTIKKGQQYKVYSYDNKRYAIGGGEYIEVQDGVTYVFGWITVKEPITLYKPDGTAERTLKAGEKYRVYRADGEVLHLGGGFTIKRNNSKYEFLKN